VCTCVRMYECVAMHGEIECSVSCETV